MKYGAGKPKGYPDAPWSNAVLQTQTEVDGAIIQVQNLGLPVVRDAPKNWDTLAALSLILKNTGRDARIFDAGGERYSMILPWLALYGYKNLIAGNLVFSKRRRRGPIVYQHCDITETCFQPKTFSAITCLSVIEHGVDLHSYFKEMSRILKPGGILITSADYYESPTDTKGQYAYGVPIHILTKDEILHALEVAQQFDLIPLSPLNLSSKNKVVHWKEYDLRYTFIIFSLCKVMRTNTAADP